MGNSQGKGGTVRTAAAVAAALAATITGGVLTLGASPASAEHPNTVCSYWDHTGDRHVQVDWMAGRSFRVAITDLTMQAEVAEAGDAYLALPLDPDLRLSANTVRLGAHVTASDISSSQGVAATGLGGDGQRIDNYLRLPAAPWESATLTGPKIVWLHDVDARSDGNGVQTRPSEHASASERAADSAGVLDFTVTIPDDVDGDVSLFDEMNATRTAGVLSAETDAWTAGQPQTSTLPGCAVTVEAAVAPESPETPSDAGAPNASPPPTAKQNQPGEDPAAQARPGSSGENSLGDTRPPAHNPPRASGEAPRADTGTRSSDGDSASRGGNRDVAAAGGENSAPWLIAAGTLAALGLAASLAAWLRARSRRAAVDRDDPGVTTGADGDNR